MHFKNQYYSTDFPRFVINFSFFTEITFSASSINQVDELEKVSNIEGLRTLRRNDRKEKDERKCQTLSDTCHPTAFALSI